jgi:hypothetical protein
MVTTRENKSQVTVNVTSTGTPFTDTNTSQLHITSHITSKLDITARQSKAWQKQSKANNNQNKDQDQIKRQERKKTQKHDKKEDNRWMMMHICY